VLLLALTGLVSGCGRSDIAASVGAVSFATRAATTAVPARSFTLAATGAALVHMPVATRARRTAGGRGYDFRPMLARIRPILVAADLAVCHIETPLSATNRDVSGYPVFSTPHELADALSWAGFDECSTASNHSLDHGKTGVSATLDALDRVSIGHDGTARSAQEAEQIRLRDVRGVQVAQLSYTYGTNGIPAPRGAEYLVNLTDADAVLARARRARAAGAEFVILSMHWGQEYRSQPTTAQRQLARRLLASPDVDLIIGDHVHVVQPVERFGDEYVIYGMGNLLSNQSAAAGLPAGTEDGMLVTAQVVQRGDRFVVENPTTVPTFCQLGSYVVWPVKRTLAARPPGAPSTSQLRASLRRTTAVLSSVTPRTAIG
jgi:poly-gamma-glutamate synthesis protein (capsule biosynthesis protein)